MIDMISCPHCHCRVVWRFFYPWFRNVRQKDFRCQKCGQTWKERPTETQGQFGRFIGNWQPQEMTRFEENIESVDPETDWNFFKGRVVWTAWQDNTPELLIYSKTVDELVYWVAMASQAKDDNWYNVYKKLSESTLPVAKTSVVRQ